MINKSFLINVILLFLFFAFTCEVVAVPFTSMGFMKAPDAYVLPRNIAEFSVSGYTYNENSETTLNCPDKWNFSSAYTLNVGILNWAEIGLVYNILQKIDINKEREKPSDEKAFRNDNIEKDIFYVNAKLNLVKETDKFPAISIGIENLFSENYIDSIYIQRYKKEESFYSHDIDDYRKNSLYIAGTKRIQLQNIPIFGTLEVCLTAGLGYGRFITTSKDMPELLSKGIFLAINSKLSDKFMFVLEEDGYCINAGIQYNIKNLSAKLGFYRIDELVTFNPHPRIAFSLQYTFDLLSKIGQKAPPNTLIFNLLSKKSTSKVKQEITKTENIKIENPLEEELKKTRERRKKAEKELEELRKLLEE